MFFSKIWRKFMYYWLSDSIEKNSFALVSGYGSIFAYAAHQTASFGVRPFALLV